jgi:release factor glutamine methyltransferase
LTTLNLSKSIDPIEKRLAAVSDTPALDAQLLVAHVLGKPRTWVRSHPEVKLSTEQTTLLDVWVLQLEQGYPLPYILGEWEFFGLTFTVTPAVLIPRPETELLVEEALRWLKVHPYRRLVADVGTGSACIAVSIAANQEDVWVLASDISLDAMIIARQNIHRHGQDKQVSLLQADLLQPVGRPFDLICANLPYIPSGILSGLKVVKWEPPGALDGGPDGLGPIRRLLEQAVRLLAPGGLFLLEVEAGQREIALEAARDWFPTAHRSVLPDLAGNNRLLRIQS